MSGVVSYIYGQSKKRRAIMICAPVIESLKNFFKKNLK